MKRRKLFASAVVLASPSTLLSAEKVSDLAGEIDKSQRLGTGVVRLPAGRFSISGIQLEKPIRIEGIPGQTFLQTKNGEPVFSIANADDVSLFGLSFSGNTGKKNDPLAALVDCLSSKRLLIDQCSFSNAPSMGLRMNRCTGQVTNCHFSEIAYIALYSANNNAMRITGNTINDIGNNGIQLIDDEEGVEGGILVDGNFISNIHADEGGSGQNGNGIGIFRSANVIVSNNRVSKTAYSSIRCNTGKNVQIIGNNVSHSDETAIYVEFAFLGAVVANNIIDGAAFGISITNLDVGGRMAVCTGNVIRNLFVGHSQGVTNGGGIHAEADTLVANNIIEGAILAAINLGWYDKCRNLIAQGNIIRNSARGISFSMAEGARHVLIAGNMIEGATTAAIVGVKGDEIVTGDFMKGADKMPAHVNMYGNVVTG